MDTCPDRYDTDDMALGGLCTVEFVVVVVVASDATLRELRASALFCLFANVGICSSGLDG